MSSDITLQDPQELRNFAVGIRTIVTNLTTAKSNADPQVALPPVTFGQGASISQPLDLQGQFTQRITDITANFQTLIAKLNLIADAADAIAKKYSDATAFDHLSAADVQAALSLPVTG